MTRCLTEIPLENLLIRQTEEIKEAQFKVDEIGKAAERARWVVFLDDSTKYIKGVLDSGITNCLAINVPLGVIKPDFKHDRLVTIGRYPYELQGMYPLLYSINKALSGIKGT